MQMLLAWPPQASKSLDDNVGQIRFEKQNPETKPDELDDGDDADADAEAQEAADLRQEVDPGHGRLSSELKDGRASEEDVQSGDVGVEGVVAVVGGREDVAAFEAARESSLARLDGVADVVRNFP